MGDRVWVWRRGDQRDQGHGANVRSQAIAARLRAMTTRIWSRFAAYHVGDLRHARQGFGNYATHRCAAELAAGSAERVRAKTLAPAVQGRVCRRPLPELRPGDLPQAPVSPRVVRDFALDDGEAVELAREHVAGQHAEPCPASVAPREDDARLDGDRPRDAEVIGLEKHEPTPDRGTGQRGAPVRGATRVNGDSRAGAKTASRPSTRTRSRGRTMRR